MSSYMLHKNFILVVLLCFYIAKSSKAELKKGFYQESCSQAEDIVKDEVRKGFITDKGVAAGLLRLHFHDCFVRGCDGSVLIDSNSTNTAEKDAPNNNPSLRFKAFEIIDNAKASLERACPGVVSCADILAFAARDSIEITGGLCYDVLAGRRDGSVSLALDALTDLPRPTFNLTQLTQLFASKSLSQDDMVTLSGSHTLGRVHCTSLVNRLYNFSANASQDPSLDPKYAAQLKRHCPLGSKAGLVVPMDPTPALADVEYYKGVLLNRGAFSSDEALLTSPRTKAQVEQNAIDPAHWRRKLAEAMVKMGNIGVLTGNQGEIRTHCRKING